MRHLVKVDVTKIQCTKTTYSTSFVIFDQVTILFMSTKNVEH